MGVIACDFRLPPELHSTDRADATVDANLVCQFAATATAGTDFFAEEHGAGFGIGQHSEHLGFSGGITLTGGDEAPSDDFTKVCVIV